MFMFTVLLLTISSQVIIGDEVTDGTELVMTFLVNRHGDRTPVESSMTFSTNRDALEELSLPFGFGQLTNVGKRRAYQLGKYIRERYHELLAPQFNRSEVYIRSTDSTRAKMTILSALAAIYPPSGERWNEELAWEPVPYTTVPAKYDFNLAMLNCPKFMSEYKARLLAPSPEFSAKFSDVLNKLTNELGTDFIQRPGLVYPLYDVFKSQLSLGLTLGDNLDAMFNEIEEAAGAAIGLTFGVDDLLPLEAGVLLDEFYKYSEMVINGEHTQKLRIYSAHDVTVYAFKGVTKVDRHEVPKYASAYALEVRKVISTGAYVVLPVYLPSPGEDVVYLQVNGCDLLCDYDQFVQLTEENSLDIHTWREQCEFTESIEIDDSLI